MYRFTKLNENKHTFWINKMRMEAENVFDAIQENFEDILILLLGYKKVEQYKRELQLNIRYEISIRSDDKRDYKCSVTVFSNDVKIDQYDFEMKSNEFIPEMIDELILVENEKFYGLSELATLLQIDKRKLGIYISRGKVKKPSFNISSGPVWIGKDIENKVIIERTRGKKIDENI